MPILVRILVESGRKKAELRGPLGFWALVSRRQALPSDMALIETGVNAEKRVGEGGGGGWGLGLGWVSSSGYFAAVPKAPWPINRLFEFPPWRACHVSIRQGLFLLPVRLLAAGGSHTSQLAVHCCLVPGRLSCLCVCMCMSTGVRVRACVCTANFMSSGYSFR